MRTLVLCLLGRRHVCPHTCRASETGHRLSVKPGFVEEGRGPPRLRDRPLRTCHGRTPRRIPSSPCPKLPQGIVVAFRQNRTLGIREDERFRGRSPTARTFACLRFADPISESGARLAPGSGGRTLGRAGCAPAGRCTKFHGGIASSTPLRPTGPGRTILPIRSALVPPHAGIPPCTVYRLGASCPTLVKRVKLYRCAHSGRRLAAPAWRGWRGFRGRVTARERTDCSKMSGGIGMRTGGEEHEVLKKTSDFV